MVTTASMDPAAWLRQQLETADVDLLREMVRTFAEALMSADADAVCGAAYGEVSAARVNRRNGYRSRDWDTRAGTIELAVPKLRSPVLPEPSEPDMEKLLSTLERYDLDVFLD